MYYENPFGLPEIQQRLYELHKQFAGVPGVVAPDAFAAEFYAEHLAWAKSPYTEGSSFGHIEAAIEQKYLNQPALVAARGATVDLYADPGIQSVLAQSAAAANERWKATQEPDNTWGIIGNIASAVGQAFAGNYPGAVLSAVRAVGAASADAPNVPGAAAQSISGRALQLSGSPTPSGVGVLSDFFRGRCYA